MATAVSGEVISCHNSTVHSQPSSTHARAMSLDGRAYRLGPSAARVGKCSEPPSPDVQSSAVSRSRIEGLGQRRERPPWRVPGGRECEDRVGAADRRDEAHLAISARTREDVDLEHATDKIVPADPADVATLSGSSGNRGRRVVGSRRWRTGSWKLDRPGDRVAGSTSCLQYGL